MIVHLLDVDMTLCRFILVYTNVMKVRNRSRLFWKSALYEDRTGCGWVSAAKRRGAVWQVLDDEFVAGLDNIFGPLHKPVANNCCTNIVRNIHGC